METLKLADRLLAGRPFSFEIQCPVGGIENCAFIWLRGEMIFAELPQIFDRIRPHIVGATVNLIVDRAEATSFGHLSDYLALFRHVYGAGVRRWNCVVIDGDLSRGRFLQFVSDVAASVGLAAQYRHILPGEDPLGPMRQLLAEDGPAGAALPPLPGDVRRVLRSTGNQLSLPGLTMDVERDPGGLPNAFLIRFTGHVRFSEMTQAFDAIRDRLDGGTFNLVSDQREATNDVQDTDLLHVYRHFRDSGVRAYRTVVVGAVPVHRELLQRAEAIARALGIEAEIAVEDFVDTAILRLARMMGRDDLLWTGAPDPARAEQG